MSLPHLVPQRQLDDVFFLWITRQLAKKGRQLAMASQRQTPRFLKRRAKPGALVKRGARGFDPAATITYSREVTSKPKRVLVRSLENLTGRIKLVKIASNYQDDINDNKDFWSVAFDRLKLNLLISGEGLAGLPSEGPTVFVANHPYGIIDGLCFGRLLSLVRKDFKILTNSVLCQIPEVQDNLLPISFEESRRGVEVTLESRKKALACLAEGGAIGVFPGGTVSTSARMRGRAIDPEWKNFTAKMIIRSNAQVIPLYFEGQNSRLFQIASHLSSTLRLSLFLNEVHKKIGDDIEVVVGKPIDPAQIEALKSKPSELMEMLRVETYGLSGRPVSKGQFGWPHRPPKPEHARPGRRHRPAEPQTTAG